MDQHKRILLVEDNATNIILFQDILQTRGYQVEVATTGFHAFELLESFHPDLILMDIQLPEIDGLSIVRAIRSTPQLQHVKILGISAFAMQSDINAAIEAGCNGYITKPISIQSFLNEVEKHLYSELS